MAIAYKSQGAGAGTETSGAALNLVCPATVDANDILIAHVMHTGITTAPTEPAGWTLLYGPANFGTGTATARAWVFGKLAVGDEDGDTISFGTDGGTNGRAGRIYSFSGYVSGTLADVVPAASFSDIPSETDPQGPDVTTTVAGALAVALFGQDDNNTKAEITGMTGGTWTEPVAEFVSSGLGPQGLSMAINVCTPDVDPGTVTNGSSAGTNDESSTIGFEIRSNAPAANVTVTPGTAALTAATFAPTVTASDHKTVTPSVIALTTTAFAPTVTASDHKTVTPSVATLTLTAFAPTVTGGSGTTVTPGTASLSLSTFAPSVSATDHKTVVPGMASLVTTLFTPLVTTTANVLAVPGVASLVLTAFAPTVTASGGIPPANDYAFLVRRRGIR